MTVLITIDSLLENHQWWSQLLLLYAGEGAPFEIHCWNDETELIHLAEQHGFKARNTIPDVTIITGKVTQEWVDLLITGKKPESTSGYNKMTPFYIVRIGEKFSSEQYGTSLLLSCDTAEESNVIDKVINAISCHANIYRNA